MKKAIFYHAGCPVCITVLNLMDPLKMSIEVIHLGKTPNLIKEAEQSGVKSVPALVLEGGEVLHINFGASLEDVKELVAAKA